jgi:hypothetical protein
MLDQRRDTCEISISTSLSGFLSIFRTDRHKKSFLVYPAFESTESGGAMAKKRGRSLLHLLISSIKF